MIERGKRASVLVIDDEEILANAVKRLLSSLHDVTVVHRIADARSALASSNFDAIVCDLMLPDGTGMELHAEIVARDPRLAGRMLFTTGGAYTDVASTFLASVSNPHIEKPFDVKALRAAVGALVDSA
jgi:DNA-binding NtrC family response regulator